jgi:hypothetical protein
LNLRNSSRARLSLGLSAVLSLVIAVGSGGCGSGSASKAATTAKSESADNTSIQGYGAAASGASKSAVSGAVHSFLTAMADRDFGGMCAELAMSNREQLARFAGGTGGSKGCAGALRKLLNPGVATEARTAADASVTSVRIKGDTAFAIFTPKGGAESYLVLKREGAAWKAISVTPGTPLEPTANS